VPSPLVGEGGDAGSHNLARVRGFSPRFISPVHSRTDTPHPALRATFSHKGRREVTSSTQNAADVAVRRICPLTLRFFRSASGAYFFSANTQTTPPCGTAFGSSFKDVFAKESWMRWASTPHPDWMAMYSVSPTW